MSYIPPTSPHHQNYYFPDEGDLVKPIHALDFVEGDNFAERDLKDVPYKEGYRKLNAFLRKQGEFVPPLVNIYMNLSPTMKTFGTCINRDFGNVEETGILINIPDIYDEKKERHMKY